MSAYVLFNSGDTRISEPTERDPFLFDMAMMARTFRDLFYSVCTVVMANIMWRTNNTHAQRIV